MTAEPVTNPPHNCPGGCGALVPHGYVACETCWCRLPAALQKRIANGDQHNPAEPPPTKADAADAVQDIAAMLAGTGRHADHQRKQVGRCAYCSCGLRVQGRLS